MRERIQKLLDERMNLVQENRSLLDKAAIESRSLNPEEKDAYDKRDARIDAIGQDVELMEKQEKREAAIAKPAAPKSATPGAPAAEKRQEGQERQLTEKEKRMWGARATESYEQEFREFLMDGQYEKRDGLTAGNPTAAGYILTPQTFIAELIKFTDDMVAMRRLARKFQLGAAASLGAPSLDTDVADADWTPEITATTVDSALAFGKRELTPHQLTKEVKISRQLLRQAVMSPEAIVRERLAYKFAVTEEKAFLTGSGAQQPLGVFTASTNGISTGRDVSTGNTSTSIGTDGLIEALHTLKSQYFAKATWLFHRDAIKQIRKLKDGNGQYIWAPGLTNGMPNSILDRPYELSEFAPNTFTTGLYVGIVGDFSFYWIADALNMDIQVLTELYARTNQNGYIGRMELDGMPVLEEAFVRVKLA